MIEVSNNLKKVNSNLKKDYIIALKDPKFKAIVVNLNLSEDVAMKYTSKIENTARELSNCENCSNLLDCKNALEGCVYYPKLINNRLIFSYVACKYKKMQQNMQKENIPSMKDIHTDDKKRVKVIKWITKFYNDYKKGAKGLYLHGSFGCGKTYLISALFNELSKKRVTTCIIYFPQMLRDLKGDFDNFAAKMDYYLNVELLLIDDIGAEKVTSWGRDEILGTILQYRMENNLTTFLTSNLNIEELEIHLAINQSNAEEVKSRRIIERIKQLTEDIELISENKRK